MEYLVISICSSLISVLLIIMFFVKKKSYKIQNDDIKKLKNQVEQANKSKNEFLSSLSHEIRTPLNVIVGLSEDNMRYENKLPVEVAENIKDIQNASQTLLQIVGNILDIHKVESEKIEIVSKPYNFKEEINNLCKIISPTIVGKPVQFRIYIAEDIPYELIGDKAHIKQIINNLLSNAVKYTEKGYVNLNIKCINQNGICNLTISVQDTGIGMKPELINKLFRLEEENTITGGIGLSITKLLVDKMGGELNVQSGFGKGTTFIVEIPQKISKMIAPINELKNIINTEVNYGHKKILIVDDNKLNIKVAAKALSDFDFEIDECYDGLECLEKINSGNKYDLILMDIMMPNMNGEDVVQKLQEDPTFKTPVIALTADAVSGAREKYIDKGFTDYIAKPFSRNQIKEKLNSIFSKKTSLFDDNYPEEFFDATVPLNGILTEFKK